MSPAKKPAKSTSKTRTPDGKVSLLLFDNQDGSEIDGVDLTGKEFELLQRRTVKLKTSLAQMLSEGVLQMSQTKKLSARLGPELFPGFSASEGCLAKPAKTSAEKSALKKSASSVAECAGKTCAADCWIKLGLVRNELAALKGIAQLLEVLKDQTADLFKKMDTKELSELIFSSETIANRARYTLWRRMELLNQGN